LGVKTPPLSLLEKLYFPYLKQHKLFSMKYLYHIVAFRDEKCTETRLRAFVLQKKLFTLAIARHSRGKEAEREGEGKRQNPPLVYCMDTRATVCGHEIEDRSFVVKTESGITATGLRQVKILN
jgi:hypothetical protein